MVGDLWLYKTTVSLCSHPASPNLQGLRPSRFASCGSEGAMERVRLEEGEDFLRDPVKGELDRERNAVSD